MGRGIEAENAAAVSRSPFPERPFLTDPEETCLVFLAFDCQVCGIRKFVIVLHIPESHIAGGVRLY